MMWNWLDVGARVGGDDRALRRLALPPRPDALFDLAERESVTLLRRVGQVHRRRPQGRRAPGRHPRPAARCARSARPARRWSPEGFECVYDAVKADVHLASISGGTDLCGCLVAGDPDPPGLRRRDPAARRSAWPSTCSTSDGDLPARARGASWCAQRRSRRCRSASGATTTATALPRRLLRARSPASGTTATSPRGPSTAAWSSTVAATPRSTRAGCASAPPRSTGRSSRSPRSSRPARSARSGTATRGSCCSCGCAEGAELDDDLHAEIRRPHPRHGCSPRHVPGRIVAVADIPRTRSGKLVRARGARRRPRPAGAERRGAGEPRGARILPRPSQPEPLIPSERRGLPMEPAPPSAAQPAVAPARTRTCSARCPAATRRGRPRPRGRRPGGREGPRRASTPGRRAGAGGRPPRDSGLRAGQCRPQRFRRTTSRR